jgi:hypothetical protein
MAIITYEGFENYSSFDAVKSYLNYSNLGTISFISSTDANSVTPRNSGTCLKSVSSGTTYPKFLLTSPNNTNTTSGVFGFSWYNLLPAGGSWGTFTPICGVIDPDGVAHFYIGVNSNGNILVRRLNSGNYNAGNTFAGPSNFGLGGLLWNTNSPTAYGCGKNGCEINYYPLFGLENIATLLGTSSTLVTANAWNYIEVKYLLSGSSTGYIQIKINRNSTDATLDINLQNTQTTARSNTNSRSLVFGIHKGHASNQTNGGTNTSVYTSYFDDIYWADLTGSNNDFLGRVSCKKFSYNDVTSYNMPTPANSGTALSNFNEAFTGSGTINTRNIGNVVGQTLDVKSTGVSSETLSPIFVRQYVHGYKTEANSDIALGTTDGANSLAVSGINLNNDSINGVLKYRDYDNAPDGNEWTNQKIANTTFRHTVISS